MFTHRHTLLFTAALLITMLAMERRADVPDALYVLLGVLFISVEAYGAANISSGFHLRSVCKGSSAKKEIALTFDDGPTEQTIKILDHLKKADVQATFFLIGDRIRGNEAIVKRMAEEGHTIGNHSFEHNYWFDLKTKKKMVTDLQKTEQLISSITGRKPVYFRPPYGVTTPALAQAVRKLGYFSIGWSVRSLDTLEKGTEATFSRIKDRLHPGAIVLLHDPVKGTEFVLEKLLHDLPAEGYRIVPLPLLIDKDPYG